MSTENGYVTFSLRIPVELCNQVDMQAHILKRSRNKQVWHLIEMALDIQAARDKKLQAEASKLMESESSQS